MTSWHLFIDEPACRVAVGDSSVICPHAC